MLKKLACLLALIATPILAQQTPQAIPLTSGACKLDGTVGCGAGGGGGSGTVTSVAMSGGTTGLSFSGGPITTSGTFTLSGTLAIANGGTNLTTYTLGDILYSSAANTLAKLSGNTTTTKKFLMQVGDGVNSAAPTWTATAADFPTLNQNTTGNAATVTTNANLTGPVTSVGNATAIADGAIALSKLANGTAGNVVTYSAAGTIAVTSTGTSGQVLTSNGPGAAPTFQSGGGGGANTALSNLASVAINTALVTGAGTAAQFTATAPAAISTAQAGVAAGMTASAAVAGSSVAGAAAGGSITFTAGAAARLTSGNADGGGFVFVGGAGVGTGKRGTPSAPGSGGATSEAWGAGAVASAAPSTAIGASASAASVNSIAIGSSASASGASGTAVGTNASVTGIAGTAIGASAWAAGEGIALGFSASAGANQFVVGTPSGSGGAINVVYIGRGVTATTAGSIVYRGTGGSGTNSAGAPLTIAGGTGTGNAAGGAVRIQTSPSLASGSTAQTLADRMVYAAKPVALTESTDTIVLNVGVASGTVAGGVFSYTIRADDATDFQVIRGDVPWSAVNKGGTITATLGTPIEVTTASTGTLTNTTTAVVNGNTIDFKLNAVSSLTQTTLHAYVSGTLDGTGVFTTQ